MVTMGIAPIKVLHKRLQFANSFIAHNIQPNTFTHTLKGYNLAKCNSHNIGLNTFTYTLRGYTIRQ